MASAEITYRIGTDIGGTFTDLVLLGSDGSFRIKKVLSTPPDFETAVVTGVRELLTENGVEPRQVKQLAHATTVATNAVLERAGAKTGLITTHGFRDVLEIRRMRFPDMYNLFWEKPAPLVERYLRREVGERVGAHGEVITALDAAEAERVVRELVEGEKVEALAVCLINAFINPVHEQAVGAIVRRCYPDLPLSLSSTILPEMKEYERTSTTVLNSYLMPVVRDYLQRLERALRELGVDAPVVVMQSNGGMMTLESARGYPMYILESGPAAGVVGAAEVARGLGVADAVTFDMGGTTAKSSLIEGGEPYHSAEYEVGAPISIASRVLKGGGYMLRAPTIDVAEIGAGGGSIVHLDQGGALRVGPRSAGARPGPVCYGRGGEQPTVTDANLVLGYLNPVALLGGHLPVQRDRAEAALGQVAQAIGLPLLETAYGVYEIANAAMMRALRAVSTERGRDVRQFTLMVFGGNGPVHAVALAQALEMKRVLVPVSPGVFSATGLLHAQIDRHYAESARAHLAGGPAGVEAGYQGLEARARREFGAEGWAGHTLELQRYAELRYRGQSHDLRVAVPPGTFGAATYAEVVTEFEREHERTYGHAHEREAVELVTLRLRARIPLPAVPALHVAAAPTATGTRRAYFGPQHGLCDTPVVGRAAVAGGVMGPLIIEEYDTTIVVPPGCRAILDTEGNVMIEVR